MAAGGVHGLGQVQFGIGQGAVEIGKSEGPSLRGARLPLAQAPFAGHGFAAGARVALAQAVLHHFPLKGVAMDASSLLAADWLPRLRSRARWIMLLSSTSTPHAAECFLRENAPPTLELFFHFFGISSSSAFPQAVLTMPYVFRKAILQLMWRRAANARAAVHHIRSVREFTTDEGGLSPCENAMMAIINATAINIPRNAPKHAPAR